MDDQLRKDLTDIKVTVNALTTEVAVLRTDLKAAFKRIDEQKTLTESVQHLALSIRETQLRQQHIKGDIERMFGDVAVVRRDVLALKEEPAAKWKTITMDVIKLLVAAGIGALLMKLGLG